MREGLTNGSGAIKTQSERDIILKNVITPFNILNFVLAALVLLVGSFKNMLFMGVILCNILIGSFQEIRAKHTIDKLSLVAAPRAHVVRDGKLLEIPVEEIVLDDILRLSAGGQVCADCILVSGQCEVNESLLTGESDPIVKGPGDLLLSGSFVVSGSCLAKAEHVGADNYASQITNSAKYVKKPNSEILYWINRIIKWVSVVIAPVGLLLFCKQYFLTDSGIQDSVVSTVAALVGMIPEGLVLLTSVVLAVSVLRLSRHKTLVQELYCIETLARVDTPLPGQDRHHHRRLHAGRRAGAFGWKLRGGGAALSALAAHLPDENPTALAIKARYLSGSGLGLHPGTALLLRPKVERRFLPGEGHLCDGGGGIYFG